MILRASFVNKRWLKSKDCRLGFTVLELLLALGLATVIAVSLMMVYVNALRAEGQSRRINEGMMKSFMILKSVEDDVLRSVNYRYRPSGQKTDQLIFQGESSQLAFVKETDKGLVWVKYTTQDLENVSVRSTVVGNRMTRNQDQVLERQLQSHRLQKFIRRQARFLGGPDPSFDPVNDEILTDQLLEQGLSFAYGRFTPSQGMSWEDNWSDNSWPSAIKVEVKLIPDAKAKALELSKIIVLPTGL